MGESASGGERPLPTEAETLSLLLGEAGAVADAAVDRLRGLSGQYPADLPPAVVRQVERGRAGPQAERRAAVRLPGGPDAVPVHPSPPFTARVLDRSPGGVLLRADSLLLPGSVVRLRLASAGGGDWFAAQVRHCRPDGAGWVVGCEFVGDRPGPLPVSTEDPGGPAGS